MTSERERRNSVPRGILGVIVAAVTYVAIPLVLMRFVFPNYLPSDIEVSQIEELLRRFMYSGIPIIALSFPAWYYAKGDGKRFAWNVAVLVYSCFALVYVLNFGDLEGLVTVNGVTLDVVLMWLLVLIVVFKLLRIIVLYGDHLDWKAELESEGSEEEILETADSTRVKGRFS